MPIQNINGKTVYVITPTKVEASKDSTGNSWATMYARQRQNIWDQLALNAANEQELALKQKKLINDRIMNLEDTIGQLQRGELDARKAIEMNNADNITQIEKAKLQAAEVVTSSRVSSGSGRGGGYGSSGEPTGGVLSIDEKKFASAITTGTKAPTFGQDTVGDAELAKGQAGQFVANTEAKLSAGTETNVLNINGVKQTAAQEYATQLYNLAKKAGRTEDQANEIYNTFLDNLPAEYEGTTTGSEDTSGGSGGGGGGYSSTSSYRKATPQAAIAAAQPGLTDVSPDAAAAITGLQDKIARLETQLGGISGGETTRQRFAQEVGGIWGFAERPNYMQSYQEPAGTVDRIGQLVDSYKVIARKALVERAAQNAAKDKTTPIPVTDDMVTQYAMKMLRDDISKGREGSVRPVTEDEYMRKPKEQPSALEPQAPDTVPGARERFYSPVSGPGLPPMSSSRPFPEQDVALKMNRPAAPPSNDSVVAPPMGPAPVNVPPRPVPVITGEQVGIRRLPVPMNPPTAPSTVAPAQRPFRGFPPPVYQESSVIPPSLPGSAPTAMPPRPFKGFPPPVYQESNVIPSSVPGSAPIPAPPTPPAVSAQEAYDLSGTGYMGLPNPISRAKARMLRAYEETDQQEIERDLLRDQEQDTRRIHMSSEEPEFKGTRRAKDAAPKNLRKERETEPPVPRKVPTVDTEGAEETSTMKLRRQRVNEALADILTADKVSDENPNIARQNKDTLVGKIARMEKDPNKALIEIDRAYEGDEKALKKNKNIYLAMYLAGEKSRA